MNNLKLYERDLNKLIDKGRKMQLGFLKELEKLEELENKEEIIKRIGILDFTNNYENWYTESIYIINQLIPNRLEDFVSLYKNDNRKELDFVTYTISDYLLGLVSKRGQEIMVDGNAAFPKFQSQIRILSSVKERFNSSLFEIKQLVQADIFDKEIELSRVLLEKGFFRAAGTICVVVIEKHFRQVLESHGIISSKKTLSISDYNDLLKSHKIIDVSTWRFIQRMNDIRNVCVHGDREPTKEDIDELISGADKLIKTIH